MSDLLAYIKKHAGLTASELSEDLGRDVKAELVELQEADLAKKIKHEELTIWVAK